jgi:alkanesulfonate monooxygenase SsuD/methylene tetrahydromethanopterin reductase-like flavin-dependent oxidoreductase (luciferase family)
MKFGLFYEHQLPAPWDDSSELRLYQDTLDQIELADRLGIEYAWAVEHHFLEEHSHCSAPEVFLAACSQRTRRIRLGHSVMIMSPKYNHPARAAERIATLDLVSGGRVDWGTGQSSSALEREGFMLRPDERQDVWRETVEQAANMLVMQPYPGFKGRHFEMPCRNLVPKPVQKPHPPLWLGCSRRETIRQAARNGVGVLAFAFVEPEQAAHWVREYYDIIRSDACVPIGHTVNANIALVCGFSMHREEKEALARGWDGLRFLGYSLGWASIYGRHRPGRSNVWDSFVEARGRLPQLAGRGAVGTPDQVRRHLTAYEEAGVDQIIFAQQCGRTLHGHICESLELFAQTLMPQFKERDAIRARQKERELAPFIAAALSRKVRMPDLAEADIPVVDAFGRRAPATHATSTGVSGFSDRGGAIPVPGVDPSDKANEPR